MRTVADVLHQHDQLLRGAIFALFVVLGATVMYIRDEKRRRIAIQLFLVYTLAINAALVVARTEAWPFSRYPMMAVPTVDPTAENTLLTFRGVDRYGREWKIDTLAWSPLFPAAIMGWVVRKLPALPAAERKEALRFLLQKAESARELSAQHRRFGNDALLGPLAASDVFVYGARAENARAPFVALRIYRTWWRGMNYSDVRRVLIAEEHL
jgi:hypothetical protein